MEKIIMLNSDKSEKLHVGCGPNSILEGWTNVDIRDFKGIDRVMDVTEPWPWSGSLKYVFGEHFLEHLSFDQAASFLSHSYDALTVGGKIRLSTPSLEWVIKTHFDFSKVDADSRVHDNFCMNRAFHGWGHKFLYSKDMLNKFLISMGFEDVVWVEYGESTDLNLLNLEQHGKPSLRYGFPSIWICEATKKNDVKQKDEEFLEYAYSNFGKYVASGH